jgi:glutamyl-tRNA reductase
LRRGDNNLEIVGAQIPKPINEGRSSLKSLLSNESSFLRDINTHVAVVGSNFKTAPISKREKLAKAITLDRLLKLKGELGEKEATELVLLSTCNRIEVYLAGEGLGSPLGKVANLFSELLQEREPGDGSGFYHYSDRSAIEHLFEVASGLDSLVLGEAQILLQVSEAAKRAYESGLGGQILLRLFSKAASTGREIRESYPKFTNGFRNSISLSVLDIIDEHFKTKSEAARPNQRKPNLLLIGSGKMIKLAIESLRRSHFGEVIVAARSASSNKEVIRADRVVHLSQLAETFASTRIDVVITATSSDSYILSAAELEPYLQNSKSNDSRLLIIDISVPRNVDPRLADYSQRVILYNIDDLREKISVSDQNTLTEIERAQQLQLIRNSISARCEEFISWLRETSQLTPLMNALRRKAESIRLEELRNALSRLPELEPSEKKVMEVMSERIVRRLLHEPTIRLKEAVRGEDSQKSKMLASAMANLFGLDLQEEQEEGEKENSGRNNDDDRMLRTFTSGKENERGTSSPI